LFILLKDPHDELLIDKISGLCLSKTNMRTGETVYYEEYDSNNESFDIPTVDKHNSETDKINVIANVLIFGHVNSYSELDYLADINLSKLRYLLNDQEVIYKSESKTVCAPNIPKNNYNFKIELANNKMNLFNGLTYDYKPDNNSLTITYEVNGENLEQLVKNVTISINEEDYSKTAINSDSRYKIDLLFDGKPKQTITETNSSLILKDLIAHDDINYELRVRDENNGTVVKINITKQDVLRGFKSVDLKLESKSYIVNFKIKGPRQFNLKNMRKPNSLRLSFPKSVFGVEGKYTYNPTTDIFNPEYSKFYKMWKLNKQDDFVFYLNENKNDELDVFRAYHEKRCKIVVNDNIPVGVEIIYNIESNLYYPKTTEKEKVIKGKDIGQQVVDETLYMPDTLLSNERISIKFKKPYGYNIIAKNQSSNWLEKNIDIPVEVDNDTIALQLKKNPPFQFFYIDLSGFYDLRKIKSLLKEKIGKNNNDYFIFISNSSRPLIWNTGDDLNELFTRISLMRPEPPSYYDETRYIEPYIDKANYQNERREIHFNFLFSESFLNHSSQKFIEKCLGVYNEDKLFKTNKVKANSYSTVDEPVYQDKEHYINQKKVTYNKL